MIKKAEINTLISLFMQQKRNLFILVTLSIKANKNIDKSRIL